MKISNILESIKYKVEIDPDELWAIFCSNYLKHAPKTHWTKGSISYDGMGDNGFCFTFSLFLKEFKNGANSTSKDREDS